jgi:hypothetical protein
VRGRGKRTRTLGNIWWGKLLTTGIHPCPSLESSSLGRKEPISAAWSLGQPTQYSEEISSHGDSNGGRFQTIRNQRAGVRENPPGVVFWVVAHRRAKN